MPTVQQSSHDDAGTTIHERIEQIMSVQQDESTFGPRPSTRQNVNRTGTSQDMNDTEAASGAQALRQGQIQDNLRDAGPLGLTSKEMRRRLGGEASGNHHGKVSGAMSSLHEVGLISRLNDRRDGAYVYVTNEHATGRTLLPYRKNTGALQPDQQKAYDDGFAAGEQAAPKPASRPHLNPAEREVIDQIQKKLPGMKARHVAAVPLKVATAEMLIAALRRLDAE